jgi:hypothetical protein
MQIMIGKRKQIKGQQGREKPIDLKSQEFCL